MPHLRRSTRRSKSSNHPPALQQTRSEMRILLPITLILYVCRAALREPRPALLETATIYLVRVGGPVTLTHRAAIGADSFPTISHFQRSWPGPGTYLSVTFAIQTMVRAIDAMPNPATLELKQIQARLADARHHLLGCRIAEKEDGGREYSLNGTRRALVIAAWDGRQKPHWIVCSSKATTSQTGIFLGP